MSLNDSAVNTNSNIAGGNRKKKAVLALVVGSVFFTVTCLFVVTPVLLGKQLNLRVLWSEPVNFILSFPFLITGLVLSVWSCYFFVKLKATPVPVYPPSKLITWGPYAYSRNPMHTGLILIMLAAGFYFSSWLSVLVFTPLYILIDVMIIKKIEEPELVKRFGTDYIKYKEQTPMFFPGRRKN